MINPTLMKPSLEIQLSNQIFEMPSSHLLKQDNTINKSSPFLPNQYSPSKSKVTYYDDDDDCD